MKNPVQRLNFCKNALKTVKNKIKIRLTVKK